MPESSERLDIPPIGEMADIACTAILGIQHFTKDSATTRAIVLGRMERIWARIA